MWHCGGAWVAQIGDLDGRGPSRDYIRARIPREALQVHQHIDLKAADKLRRSLVIKVADLVEVVERLTNALPKCSAILLAPAEGVNFESFPIMRFKKLDGQ